MANIRWSRTNYVDTASLTPNIDANPQYPAGNVQTPQIAEFWLTPYGTTLDIDFGATRTLDVLAMAQPNDSQLLGGRAASEVRWTAGSTPGASDIYDSGAIETSDINDPDKGVHVHVPASAVTTRYLRFAIPSGLGVAPAIGRIWAGPEYVFESDAASAFRRRWVEGALPVNLGETSLVAHGSMGSFAREYELQWPLASAADAEEILALQRLVGASGQILLSPIPDARNAHSIFCRPTAAEPVESIVFPRLQTARGSFLEDR
jgi:hypothetical protein